MSGPEDFERLKPTWNKLNEQNSKSPLLDAEYFEILLRYHGVPESMLLAVAYRDDTPVVAGLLTRRGFGSWQTYQPAQAPLGAWVCPKGECIDTLLNGLFRVLPGLCLVMGVTQQDPLIFERPKHTGRLRTLDYIETSCVLVDSSFIDYWKRRGKNLKKNVRRQRNKLVRDGIVTTQQSVGDPEAIGKAVDEYGLLESEGWKGKEGTSLHPDNLQGRLYRDLMEHYSKRGEAFVYQYRYGSELVASEICLHRNGFMYMLKTTHSEKPQGTSPGVLMTEDMFRDIFHHRRFHTIEFYGRTADWHPKWTNEFRDMYHINVYRSRILAVLLS